MPKRHVFLFRHCVRSVKDDIDFHQDTNHNNRKDVNTPTSSDVGGSSSSSSSGNGSSSSGGETANTSSTGGVTPAERQRRRRQLPNNQDGGRHSTTISNNAPKEYKSSTTSHHGKNIYNYPKNPLDYISHVPDWNTPPLWCTLTGSDIMKRTGSDLLQRFLLVRDQDGKRQDQRIARKDGNKGHDDGSFRTNGDDFCDASTATTGLDKTRKEYTVKFLVDQSPRDVQTAYAIMDGMADVLTQQRGNKCQNEAQIIIKGLDTIEMEPRLFDPIKMKNEFDIPLLSDKVRNVQERYRNTTLPGNITETLLWIQEKGEKRFMDYFIDNKDELVKDPPSLTEDASHFQGVFNLIKYVAETLFYSRASDIHFWESSVTTEEIYSIMTWIHWSRYILSVGNIEAAAKGAVIMARILTELEGTDATLKHNNHATFIIGHDGDIDAVATALGLSWDLPYPYHPGYSPTPPGCAIHFSYDGKKVGISFLAPILLNTHMPFVNSSGILEEVPVLFTADFEKDIMIRDRVTVLPSMTSLRNRALHVMEQYSGVVPCFYAAEKIWQHDTESSCTTEALLRTNLYASLVLLWACSFLLFGGIVISYCGGRGRGRREGRQGRRTMMNPYKLFTLFQSKYLEMRASQQLSFRETRNSSDNDLL